LASHDLPLVASQLSLAQLNERSREIFRRIVESYLATGEPVGSRNLSRILPMTLSPASVRNVMSDLEQLGLVYAPHTSAGRLPTEFGLRFFVDALMQVGDLTERDRKAIEAQVAGSGQAKSVESVLTEASALLSGLSRAAGVVLTAKSNQRLKHIEFVRLEPERALVVLVAEDGQVENRVLNIPVGLPTSALIEAGNFLNARIRGRTLPEVKAEIERRLEEGQAELDALTQKIIAAGLASWSGGETDERKLIVRGQAHLLEDLKALADLERVRLLFDDLDLSEKIKIYDKGVSVTNQQGVYDLLVSYRSGDMWAPKVEQTEALKVEANYFIDCILHNKTPVNDGKAGRRVVQLLEAADRSLKKRGKIVQL
jgi:heat-inducible transcriptional repressor